MKETLGNVIVELEKAIKPLGFEIESVDRKDGFIPLISGNFKHDEDKEKLSIRIIRAGKLV
jgi:hypothetical protein